MNRFFGFILLFCPFTAVGFDEAMASEMPTGERVFIINKDDPYAPLKIQKLSQKDQKAAKVEYLRDPSLNPQKHFSPKKQKKVVIIREKAKNYTPKKLKFKRAKIRGRNSKPRVAFKRPRLRLKRSDERPRLDFYRKSFDQEPGKL